MTDLEIIAMQARLIERQGRLTRVMYDRLLKEVPAADYSAEFLEIAQMCNAIEEAMKEMIAALPHRVH